MKARIKYNNEIIDVIQVGTKTHLFDLNNVEFLDNPQDYWTRLEHQYAGMAMQGMLQSEHFSHYEEDRLAYYACLYAHALVKKLKEKEERK